MIWFDGQLTGSAHIGATSAGATSGWGVFTTLAIRGGAPIFWERHAARLRRDAGAARVDLPFEEAQLVGGLMQLIEANDIGDGLARITGTRRGDGRWNAEAGAHWSILVRGAVAASSEPLRLAVSPFRVATKAPLAGVKTTSYLPYFHVWEEARAAGFDEAILLTESGWVCESARASIFWAKGEQLFTPSLLCGCLRGVGREWIVERNRVQQGPFRLRDLLEADEAFVVSGATGPRAIGSICDERQTRNWTNIGKLTAALQNDFERIRW